MGKLNLLYLESDKIYSCAKCNTHLSSKNEIISKEFMGGHGRSYLFNRVININQGILEDREMTTGKHTVCDIYCIYCQAIVGWKYERAYETSEKYKEGKYILERACIKRCGW